MLLPRLSFKLIKPAYFNHSIVRNTPLKFSSAYQIVRNSSTQSKMNRQIVASISDLQDGQMKEVSFGEDKILLSKFGGSFHATSAKCTHYGAQMVKGVMTCSGKVVCPWHGAKYDLTTGDIEDAPGVGSLQSFKVDIEGNDVYVTAGADVKSFRDAKPISELATAASRANRVIIIGGGGAGAHAIEGLRESGYEGKITVVSKEPYLPIDRTKLSKGLISDPSKVALRSAEFYSKLNVEFLLNSEAKSIDFDSNSVTLVDEAKHEYDSIIIATGSNPNRIPVDGSKLDNIFVMRNLEDTRAIDAALGSDENVKKNVVIVGSSFIGMESSLACSKRANVSVVGMENVPFEGILGKAVGAGIQKHHEKQGTKFYLPASLSHFSASTSSPNSVGAVVLKDGTSIPAEIVILGVGVRPATQLLKDSGLELEKDGGIVVDGNLRIAAVKKGNAFAVGDIAHYPEKSNGGKLVRVEHWNVASNHARSVAKTIAGKDEPHFDKVAVFWSAQGGQLRYCAGSSGLAKEWDDVIVQGDADALKFIAYYTKGDEIVAAASMGNDPVVAHVSELFTLKNMLSKTEIQAGKNPLDVALA